jgi:hypothetical protein
VRAVGCCRIFHLQIKAGSSLSKHRNVMRNSSQPTACIVSPQIPDIVLVGRCGVFFNASH